MLNLLDGHSFKILAHMSKLSQDYHCDAVIYRSVSEVVQFAPCIKKVWHIRFNAPLGSRFRYPTMHWCGSAGSVSQVRLSFDSLDVAIRYLESNNMSYSVIQCHDRVLKQKSYKS